MDVDLTPSEKPGLLRALGLSSAILIVVGSVIGSGIFLKPGKIAAEAGDFKMIITAWIFGGVLCLLGALCFAELATMFPQAGGLYVYLREAYGRPTAFCYGWSDFLFVRAASTGALAVAFVEAVAGAMGRRMHPLGVAGVCAILLVTIAAINIRGVVWGAQLQNVTTFAKAGGVLFLALLPIGLILVGSTAFNVENYSTRFDPGNDSGTLVRFAAALLAVMWAYDGWHQVAPIAEEVRDPQRNIPRALLGGVLILMALYVSANLAYHGILSMSELAANNKGNGAQAAAFKALGSPGAIIVSAIIICSTFGTICNNLLTTPRVPFAMARDGLAFGPIGAVHPLYRTPAVAIAVQASMAALLVFGSCMYFLFWAYDDKHTVIEQQRSMFDQLTNFAIFTGSIFYGLGVLAVIVLRIQRPKAERAYRTLGYPLVPVVFLATYMWFLFEVYRGNRFESKVGLGIIAGFFLIYPLLRKPNAAP